MATKKTTPTQLRAQLASARKRLSAFRATRGGAATVSALSGAGIGAGIGAAKSYAESSESMEGYARWIGPAAVALGAVGIMVGKSQTAQLMSAAVAGAGGALVGSGLASYLTGSDVAGPVSRTQCGPVSLGQPIFLGPAVPSPYGQRVAQPIFTGAARPSPLTF